ncbi:MAG TPA: class I SAM-dependent methyltransferase [Stellaceae bacterium]|nr:class I SAM-dependent methyltransferase [Stellaceae bacterium]
MIRVGPLVRRSFGRYERPIAEIYRRIFVDLDDFVSRIAEWAAEPHRILEIGCGEGAMTERLVRTFAGATVTGIDITPNVGRLFSGDTARVTFRREAADELAESEPSLFDLIVLCDVVHHVPPHARQALLSAARRLLAPDGALVFKDWSPSATPIHWLCDIADRYITGDDVRYATSDEAKALLCDIFGPGAIRAESRVRPWANNFALLVHP